MNPVAGRVMVGALLVLGPMLGVVTGAIQVVTSTPTLAYFATAIGGDRVQVSSLTSGKEDPHGVMPKPSMMAKVRQADVVVVSGMALDPWLTDLAKRVGKRGVQPGQSGYLDLSASGIQKKGQLSPAELAQLKGYEHVHPEGNPHYWLSIDNAQQMVTALTRTLSTVDPDGTAYYVARQQVVRTQLTQLKQRVAQSTRVLAPISYWVVHDAWAYLLANVGATVVGSVEEAPGISPGPVHLKWVFDQMKTQPRKVLLVDQNGGSRYDGYVKKVTEAGCPVAYVSQSVTPALATYEQLIDYNMGQIRRAVGQP